MDQWHTLTRFRCSWVFPGARKLQRAAPSFRGNWWNIPTGEIYSLVFSDLWISLSTLSLCYSTWCHSYSIQPTKIWKSTEAMADGANVVPQSLGLPSVQLCHWTVSLPKEQPWNMKDLFFVIRFQVRIYLSLFTKHYLITDFTEFLCQPAWRLEKQI